MVRLDALMLHLSIGLVSCTPFLVTGQRYLRAGQPTLGAASVTLSKDARLYPPGSALRLQRRSETPGGTPDPGLPEHIVADQAYWYGGDVGDCVCALERKHMKEGNVLSGAEIERAREGWTDTCIQHLREEEESPLGADIPTVIESFAFQLGRNVRFCVCEKENKYLDENPEPKILDENSERWSLNLLTLKVHKWDPDCQREVWRAVPDVSLARLPDFKFTRDAQVPEETDPGNGAKDRNRYSMSATSSWNAVRAGASKLKDRVQDDLRQLPGVLQQHFVSPSLVQKDDPGARHHSPWLKPRRSPALRPQR